MTTVFYEDEECIFDTEHYDSECGPIKCKYCGSDDIKEVTKDTINGYTCECQFECNKCLKVVSYWAYGSFDPCYAMIPTTNREKQPMSIESNLKSIAESLAIIAASSNKAEIIAATPAVAEVQEVVEVVAPKPATGPTSPVTATAPTPPTPPKPPVATTATIPAPPATAPLITLDQVNGLLMKEMERLGDATPIMGVLSEFGAANATALNASDYAAVVEKVQALPKAV